MPFTPFHPDPPLAIDIPYMPCNLERCHRLLPPLQRVKTLCQVPPAQLNISVAQGTQAQDINTQHINLKNI